MYSTLSTNRRNYKITINAGTRIKNKNNPYQYSYYTWSNKKYRMKFTSDYIKHSAIEYLLDLNGYGCMFEYIEKGCLPLKGKTVTARKFVINIELLRQALKKTLRIEKHRYLRLENPAILKLSGNSNVQ